MNITISRLEKRIGEERLMQWNYRLNAFNRYFAQRAAQSQKSAFAGMAPDNEFPNQAVAMRRKFIVRLNRT